MPHPDHGAEFDVHSTSSPETLVSEDEAKHADFAQPESESVALAKEAPHKLKSEETSDSKHDGGPTATPQKQPDPVTPKKKERRAVSPKKKQKSKSRSPPRETSVSLSESEIKDIAVKLFNEKFVSISPEEYTQFLAAPDADSAAIRECYMNLFDWDASLIKATRELCSKLYLKGESQEIDRILSAFTKSYLKQHPVNVFCTQDFEQIYIVLYSLILLNTSLHNSEVSKKSKLSQSDYIRNTLTTFLSQNKKASRALSVKQKIQIERELNHYYEDLAKKELYLKKGDPDTPKRDSMANRYSVAETIYSSVSGNHHDYHIETATASPLASRSPELVQLSRQKSNTSQWSQEADGRPRRPSFGMKRITSRVSTGSQGSTAMSYANANGMNNPAAPRFGFTRALLSDNTQRSGAPHSLRNQKSTDQLRYLARQSSRSSIITTESSMPQKLSLDGDNYSICSFSDIPQIDLPDTTPGNGQYKLENFDVSDFQDPLDLKLELQGAPYLKEGLLSLKILNNDMADHSSSGEPNASSASSTVSLSSTKSGWFSFFSRSSNKEPASTTTTLGTSSTTTVFSNKFTEYFVVVSKGELRLYSFDPKVVKKQQQKLKKIKQQHAFFEFEDKAGEDEEDVGDGNWLNNAANIGNYNLCSTIAQLEKTNSPQAPSSPSKVVFTLTFPRSSKKPQKKFVFEAGTVEVANEFVNTCNFWASKLTAVPTLEESMSSIEYGWTDLSGLMKLGDGFKKTKAISKWEVLPKGVYLSNLSSETSSGNTSSNHEGMLKQFVQTLKYYNNLRNLFSAFNRQKALFIKQFRKFSNTSNYKLVVQNYENRSEEYKTELGKYKSYITLLGYGLKLRFDLEKEEQMVAWAEEILELPDMEEPDAIAEELARRKAEAAENESDLTKAVKSELDRLMNTSESLKKLMLGNTDAHHDESSEAQASPQKPITASSKEEDPTNPLLVKSPKTFSLAHFKDTEPSPIFQLLQVDKRSSSPEPEHEAEAARKELAMSYSTNTIREEEEPEDGEDSPELKTSTT
ncbi:hypothetical protein JCM33374_g5308 [Metschnikowia sp. JCM 33374]|nr:hypothetical protein JCM33374_g5308 [Metschnikowia sp. JCM 33374]